MSRRLQAIVKGTWRLRRASPETCYFYEMGVYVFRCLAGDWVKVGHFKERWGGSRTKRVRMDNPWYRVERRGFDNVVHPQDLQGRLKAEDLELVAWYPGLTGSTEAAVHKRFTLHRCGEFHRLSQLDSILTFCDCIGERADVPAEQKHAAQLWAGKGARIAPPLAMVVTGVPGKLSGSTGTGASPWR